MKVDTREALAAIPHLQPGESQLILVVGRKGFGKTVFVGGMPGLPGYIETAEPRVLLLDLHDDYRHVRQRMDYRDAIADLQRGGPCRRRVVPPMENGRNCTIFAEEFFPAVVDGVRDCLLVIEEMSAFFKSIQIKGTPAETLVLQGRHFGIRILATCQRLNRVPGEFHSEATAIVAYNTKRPRDLDILEDWGYVDAHAEAPLLKKGECELIEA